MAGTLWGAGSGGQRGKARKTIPPTPTPGDTAKMLLPELGGGGPREPRVRVAECGSGQPVEGFMALSVLHIPSTPTPTPTYPAQWASMLRVPPLGAHLTHGFEASDMFPGVTPGGNERGKGRKLVCVHKRAGYPCRHRADPAGSLQEVRGNKSPMMPFNSRSSFARCCWGVGGINSLAPPAWPEQGPRDGHETESRLRGSGGLWDRGRRRAQKHQRACNLRFYGK